jgi:hypothetical protein
MASSVRASSTTTARAPLARRIAKSGTPSVPRRPSQIVSGTKSMSRRPVASERAVSAAPAGSASSSSQPGAIAPSVSAQPDANPPPPTGVDSTSRPPVALSSSSDAVPWPAITRGSVYGCTKAAPVSRCTRAAVSSRAAMVGAQVCRIAPYARIASSFAATAPSGTTTWHGMPRVRAASASAPPWLPDECVTTPRAASSSGSDHTALQAPRNLKAPARCSGSALKCSSQPASASSARERSTGVTWAWGAMRAAAASTSAKVGSVASMRHRKPFRKRFAATGRIKHRFNARRRCWPRTKGKRAT